MNPAFTRMHPTKNVIYSCTESVEEDGEIVCWDVCPETGKLSLLSSADAFGTSTYYITIDKVGCFSLVWNWKESQFHSVPLLGGLSRSGRQLLERHRGRPGDGQADRRHQAVGAAQVHIRPQQRWYMIGTMRFKPTYDMDTLSS